MSVSRIHILTEIRRTAEGNGGKALGRQRFRAETGLRDADWERYWPRWSDALKEAGFNANTYQGRYSEDELLRPLVAEIRRLGRMPTMRELAVRRREGAPLPNAKAFSSQWSKRELTARTLAYCRDHPDLADVAAMLDAAIAGEVAAEPDASEDIREPDFGFVYLVKSGRHYKLGRTNAVGRRERELAILLPEETRTVHTIKTDDPIGIEAYWHRRFADRRGKGEWFALTSADVRAFTRRKFM